MISKKNIRLGLFHIFSVITFLFFAGLASGTPLGFYIPDPAGDQEIWTSESISRQVSDIPDFVDLSGMFFFFDNSTGDYSITFTSHDSRPFQGDFRINVNMHNSDASPYNSTADINFNDQCNDFTLTNPASEISLVSTNPNLMDWEAGDSVATSSEPLGVPLGQPGGGFHSAITRSFEPDPYSNFCKDFIESQFVTILPAERITSREDLPAGEEGDEIWTQLLLGIAGFGTLLVTGPVLSITDIIPWYEEEEEQIDLFAVSQGEGVMYYSYIEAAPVPEPGTMLLLGSGLLGLAGLRWRFRKK